MLYFHFFFLKNPFWWGKVSADLDSLLHVKLKLQRQISSLEEKIELMRLELEKKNANLIELEEHKNQLCRERDSTNCKLAALQQDLQGKSQMLEIFTFFLMNKLGDLREIKREHLLLFPL